jgi:hypothetical protein
MVVIIRFQPAFDEEEGSPSAKKHAKEAAGEDEQLQNPLAVGFEQGRKPDRRTTARTFSSPPHRRANSMDRSMMMSRLMITTMTLVLAACATKRDVAVLPMADVRLCADICKDIETELNQGGWEVKDSLLELKHFEEASDLFMASGIQTVKIDAADGQRFQILVLSAPAMSVPGEDFVLAYLTNPGGKIVHWKSQWLSNRQGNLGIKLLDVNDDGVKEFCFVCDPFGRAEQLLAAYGVREERLDPVIVENELSITTGSPK